MNVCEAHSWCCCCGEILVKEKECVLKRRIYRKYASCRWLKDAGLEFTRADVVVSISRSPPGQWFPETEYWASAIFVGTSGIPPKIIYRSVKSYTCVEVNMEWKQNRARENSYYLYWVVIQEVGFLQWGELPRPGVVIWKGTGGCIAYTLNIFLLIGRRGDFFKFISCHYFSFFFFFVCVCLLWQEKRGDVSFVEKNGMVIFSYHI